MPHDELETHYQALTYMGSALRYLIGDPPNPLPGQPVPPRTPDPATWRGFERGFIYRPEADTEAEVDVRDEWTTESSRPDSFNQYPCFRKHMDCTLAGRRVNNALDAVDRTAVLYMQEKLGSGFVTTGPDIEQLMAKLKTAQYNLRSALTPPALVRRMVQDSECELCSSGPLERAERRTKVH